jgi:hypothetical protein
LSRNVVEFLAAFCVGVKKNVAMGGDDDDDEVRKQPQLKPQNAETVDASKLTALSPEVVSIVVRSWSIFMLESNQSTESMAYANHPSRWPHPFNDTCIV